MSSPVSSLPRYAKFHFLLLPDRFPLVWSSVFLSPSWLGRVLQQFLYFLLTSTCPGAATGSCTWGSSSRQAASTSWDSSAGPSTPSRRWSTTTRWVGWPPPTKLSRSIAGKPPAYQGGGTCQSQDTFVWTIIVRRHQWGSVLSQLGVSKLLVRK